MSSVLGVIGDGVALLWACSDHVLLDQSIMVMAPGWTHWDAVAQKASICTRGQL